MTVPKPASLRAPTGYLHIRRPSARALFNWLVRPQATAASSSSAIDDTDQQRNVHEAFASRSSTGSAGSASIGTRARNVGVAARAVLPVRRSWSGTRTAVRELVEKGHGLTGTTPLKRGDEGRDGGGGEGGSRPKNLQPAWWMARDGRRPGHGFEAEGRKGGRSKTQNAAGWDLPAVY